VVRASGPVLVFIAAAVGLNIKAKLGDFVVEHNGPRNACRRPNRPANHGQQ
jgi:hypothetical protein